ncbi:MAG: hypothetical protein AAGF59_10070 [Pseudomonadota bacterium]
MPFRLLKTHRLAALPASCLVIALSLAGCAEWIDRSETIGFNAGDAVAANKVKQIIDPWDERSGWTNLPQDGQKAASAVDSYRKGGGEETGSDKTTITIGSQNTTD